MNSKHSLKPNVCAFTLVELLTVITVILILAAVLLNVSGYVNSRAARARTEVELKTIANLLERYKADNGDYPRADTSRAVQPPAGALANSWIPSAAQQALYQCLTGDGNSAIGGNSYSLNSKGSMGKNYFESQDIERWIVVTGGFSQNTSTGAPKLPPELAGKSFGYFNDGWGRSIQYAYPGTHNTGNYYDLWSDGGGLTGYGSPSDNPGWVKNW